MKSTQKNSDFIYNSAIEDTIRTYNKELMVTLTGTPYGSYYNNIEQSRISNLKDKRHKYPKCMRNPRWNVAHRLKELDAFLGIKE